MQSSAERDPRRVMVVHGRNMLARGAMVSFLSSLALRPIGWDEAIAETGSGSPHNLATVRAALEMAQATVVLLTPDDEARLRPALVMGAGDRAEGESLLQPRPNVLFEAGLALALWPDQTILVEVGRVKMPTDLSGINSIRMSDDPNSRAHLRKRLMTAGCSIDESTTEYLNPESAGSFDGAVAFTGDPVISDGRTSSIGNGGAPTWAVSERRRLEIFLDLRRTEGAFTLAQLSEFLGGGYSNDWLAASIARLAHEGLVIPDEGGRLFRPS